MMKLKDIELVDGNHFIVMQYYGLVFNRTFLVLILKDHLMGVVVNGIVSAKGGADPITRQITTRLAISGDLENPFSYLNEEYLERVKDLNLFRDDLTVHHGSNFRFQLKDINSVSYNPRKKWGMAYYPHDGRIYIKVNEKKYEFIVLGNQSGAAIAEYINNAVTSANNQLKHDAQKTRAS